jgi:N utilization substance protein B
MSKRSNSRKLAMRMLYQLDIRNAELPTLYDDLEKDQYADETVDWAFKLASATCVHMDSIDSIIKNYSIDWEPDRLNRVDFALLRLALAEINHLGTPYQVVINEVLELSKEYSAEESAKFINGILDKYVKDSCLQD